MNLEYPLPNGKAVKFLDDQTTYLGTQLECEFGGDRYFGVLANMDFILICTYEAEGENPLDTGTGPDLSLPDSDAGALFKKCGLP